MTCRNDVNNFFLLNIQVDNFECSAHHPVRLCMHSPATIFDIVIETILDHVYEEILVFYNETTVRF